MNRECKQQYLYTSVVFGFPDKLEAKKIHSVFYIAYCNVYTCRLDTSTELPNTGASLFPS